MVVPEEDQLLFKWPWRLDQSLHPPANHGPRVDRRSVSRPSWSGESVHRCGAGSRIPGAVPRSRCPCPARCRSAVSCGNRRVNPPLCGDPSRRVFRSLSGCLQIQPGTGGGEPWRSPIARLVMGFKPPRAFAWARAAASRGATRWAFFSAKDFLAAVSSVAAFSDGFLCGGERLVRFHSGRFFRCQGLLGLGLLFLRCCFTEGLRGGGLFRGGFLGGLCCSGDLLLCSLESFRLGNARALSAATTDASATAASWRAAQAVSARRFCRARRSSALASFVAVSTVLAMAFCAAARSERACLSAIAEGSPAVCAKVNRGRIRTAPNRRAVADQLFHKRLYFTRIGALVVVPSRRFADDLIGQRIASVPSPSIPRYKVR